MTPVPMVVVAGRQMSCCSCKQLVVLKINQDGVVYLTHCNINLRLLGVRKVAQRGTCCACVKSYVPPSTSL